MQQVLADFQSSLNRVRNLANDASANTPAALSNPLLLERHETALLAVVVMLAGFFESFLRGTAEAFIDGVNQQNYPFLTLKPTIQYAHFQGGGLLLDAIGGKTRSPRHSWTTTDAFDLVRRLASVQTTTGYELVWEAFAETRGNPDSDVIRIFLKRFGVAAPLEALAAQIGYSAQSLGVALDNFIVVRNECAHTGSTNNQPQPSDVLAYCDLLEKIATGIIAVLTTHQVCTGVGVASGTSSSATLPSGQQRSQLIPSTTQQPAVSMSVQGAGIWGRLIAKVKRLCRISGP